MRNPIVINGKIGQFLYIIRCGYVLHAQLGKHFERNGLRFLSELVVAFLLRMEVGFAVGKIVKWDNCPR